MNMWKNRESQDLINAITRIKDENEAMRFFRDLLTEREIIEFSKRWKAARMLNSKISYIQICKSTGLSSKTVARISKWIKSGMGGYQLMFERINHHTAKSSEKGLS